MSIEEYRSSRNNNKINIKKKVLSFINKTLLTAIIFLLGLIITNKNASLKSLINKYVYTDNIKFLEFKKIYNKYFGKYLGESDTKKVFNEKISYSSENIYKDGVKLEVGNNYLVPALEAGIVIYIGEKEDYGTTVIVEQINGIKTWYSNINAKDIKIYDYIEKGALLGEVKDNKLYLLFEKDGKFLNYKKYI